MKKMEILKRVTASKVVAVVRANSSEEAILISEACIKGGIEAILTEEVPGVIGVEVVED